MAKQVPGLIMPRLRLVWHEHQQAKLEDVLRKQASGADEQDIISRIFRGNYDELKAAFQGRDPSEIWPEEINALYGTAITRNLNHVFPHDFFFGGPTKKGSYSVKGFLHDAGFLRTSTSERIADVAKYSFTNRPMGDSTVGLVKVQKRLLYPTIAGTVDEVDREMGFNYGAFIVDK